VLISLHTRLPISPDPACIIFVLVNEPLIDELPFILSVEIAGSIAQSDNELIFDVVARGIPLSKSSVPTVVSRELSKFRANVDIVEAYNSSASTI
jgi:hypothetical protein